MGASSTLRGDWLGFDGHPAHWEQDQRPAGRERASGLSNRGLPAKRRKAERKREAE